MVVPDESHQEFSLLCLVFKDMQIQSKARSRSNKLQMERIVPHLAPSRKCTKLERRQRINISHSPPTPFLEWYSESVLIKINHTNGPKLKEYPPATPNTYRVANTFPRMLDTSPPANDTSTNRENTLMLIPKNPMIVNIIDNPCRNIIIDNMLDIW